MFVGVCDLRLGGEPRIGHHHHGLGVGVVVAQDAAGEQLELERGDVLVGGQQAQALEQGVVRGRVLGRVVLLEARGQAAVELLAGDDLRGTDVGGGQVTDVGHVGLDPGQDLVRCRGRRALAAELAVDAGSGVALASGPMAMGARSARRVQDRDQGQGQQEGDDGDQASRER